MDFVGVCRTLLELMETCRSKGFLYHKSLSFFGGMIFLFKGFWNQLVLLICSPWLRVYFFAKVELSRRKQQILEIKSSSNKLSVFYLLNLLYCSQLMWMAKNNPSAKLKNWQTKGKLMKPMTARNENIEKQLRKPLTWFCKYYPKRTVSYTHLTLPTKLEV